MPKKLSLLMQILLLNQTFFHQNQVFFLNLSPCLNFYLNLNLNLNFSYYLYFHKQPPSI